MRRNMKIVREILEWAEGEPEGQLEMDLYAQYIPWYTTHAPEIPGEEEEAVLAHLTMISKAKLIETSKVTTTWKVRRLFRGWVDESYISGFKVQLTWEGFEVLARLREDLPNYIPVFLNQEQGD